MKENGVPIEVKQLPSGRFMLLRQGDGPLNYPSLSLEELAELHKATARELRRFPLKVKEEK